jgi:ATP-binding cassette subfamily C protein CydCD
VVLLTRGVAAAEPYLTRYLPALVLAAVLPFLAVVAIVTQDVTSAVIVLATLPLVPVFGVLIGLVSRDRAERQWRAMASLSGYFLDVVRGLPTLVAFRRAEAQTGRIREVTDRYRRASLATLRTAFASSAVLELVATLSVALVAVTVGVRLADGRMDLHPALVVLLLAPEAYWPLRRVGAEFHAAAEGVATFERVDAVLSCQDDTVRAKGGAGDLVVSDLTVRYDGRTVPALDGVCLTVPPTGADGGHRAVRFRQVDPAGGAGRPARAR